MRWFLSGPCPHPRFRAFVPGICLLAILLGLAATASASAATVDPTRTPLAGSITPVSAEIPATPHSRPAITRTALTPAETAASMEVEVAFSMRNFASLQQRLSGGARISPQELAGHYLPLAADYDRMAAWLTEQGLTITRRDPNHLALFVRGSVGQINRAFAVSFARVSFRGKEYSSAVSAPSVPAELAAPLLGINGLQPHLRMQPHALQLQPHSISGNFAPFLPSQIARAYQADGLPQTGANQTIAIVINTFPSTTDLTAFWSACGVNQSLSNIDFIQVVNGTLAAPAGEESLDVEWTSSIASAARIRVYASFDLSTPNLDASYLQIISDLPTQPNLHQVSLSYGGPEDLFPPAQLETDAQYFAAMASFGVTVFVSTGDGGSRPNPSTGQYSATGNLTPEYPATDPSVVAVGGTSLSVNVTTGQTTGETAWSGSGGGISDYFPRPLWQTGSGVPAGTTRTVPDIAADADPFTGGLVVLNGANDQFGGTSLATPICAGFCALINQARADAGLPPLGLLNPKIYPLVGSANFRDIISGSDGDYGAGVGYDLDTGLGAPLVANLLSTLVNSPSITLGPADQEITINSTAAYSLSAAGPGPYTYQWQRLPIGNTTWSNLTDNTTYSGSATANLSVTDPTTAQSGDQFQCLVSNAFGTTASFPPAALIVTIPLAVTTLAGNSSVQDSNDGLGANASFNLPIGIAVTANGTVFVADTYNQLIRKITPAGNVTTLAGQANVTGSTNGIGTAADFYYPAGIAVDASFNAYVTDNNNQVIRKITPSGSVSTYAGRVASSGSTNGTASHARFNFPIGIASTANATLYVADTSNQLIRAINPVGLVSTLAGQTGTTGSFSGVGTASQFNYPWGLGATANGTVYVADTLNNVIRKITPAGNVSIYAGQIGVVGYVDGLAANAQFAAPTGVAIDAAGNLYVCDNTNSVIRMISPAGVVSTVAGTAEVLAAADGIGPAAQFYNPFTIAVDGSGAFYIADTNNNIIRKAVLVTAPVVASPPSSQVVVTGQNAVFSLTANGTPAPSFQWQISTDGGATWSFLSDNATCSGSATSSLTLTAAAFAMNGHQFRCIATNPYGSVTSAAATLTVNVPPAFSLQPQSVSVTEGATASFIVAATGSPAPSYQWQISPDGGVTWAALADNATYSGSTTSSLSITASTVGQSGGVFRCLASNGVSPAAISASATLTVTAPTLTQSLAALGLTGNNASPTARPFADGLPNLARYAMNLGASPAPSQLPATSVDNTNPAAPALTLQYRLLIGLTGVTVSVQSSPDLLTWTNVPITDITQLANDDPQTARFQATVPLPPSTPLFLRVVFTQSP